MTTVGSVREWHEDEGWGVIDSDETPGGCWAHFSAGALDGYVFLTAGQKVCLDWESPGQESYDFRARRFWPYGSEPKERDSRQGPGGAYRSTLFLSFDDAAGESPGSPKPPPTPGPPPASR